MSRLYAVLLLICCSGVAVLHVARPPKDYSDNVGKIVGAIAISLMLLLYLALTPRRPHLQGRMLALIAGITVFSLSAIAGIVFFAFLAHSEAFEASARPDNGRR